MNIYRNPVYLDREILTPIANQWGIEVDTEIEVTARDLTDKKGGFNGNASLPGVGSVGLDLGGGTEAEISQTRVVKAHPGAALNALVNDLRSGGSLITKLENETVTKSSLVEIEGDWEVSPVTDTGAMIGALIQLMLKNPQAIESREVPPEIAASFASPQTISNRKIVLRKINESEDDTKVIALLDSGLLVGNNSEDDLEDDKTILGLVETFKPEGGSYSLERFFSGGMGRALRRQMKTEKMYETLGTMHGENFSEEDLKVPGPVVVLKVVAVYP